MIQSEADVGNRRVQGSPSEQSWNRPDQVGPRDPLAVIQCPVAVKNRYNCRANVKRKGVVDALSCCC